MIVVELVSGNEGEYGYPWHSCHSSATAGIYFNYSLEGSEFKVIGKVQKLPAGSFVSEAIILHDDDLIVQRINWREDQTVRENISDCLNDENKGLSFHRMKKNSGYGHHWIESSVDITIPGYIRFLFGSSVLENCLTAFKRVGYWIEAVESQDPSVKRIRGLLLAELRANCSQSNR